MTKLTETVEIEIVPDELVKPKSIEQKKIVPVKYYRINPNKFTKPDYKGMMTKKPRISNE